MSSTYYRTSYTNICHLKEHGKAVRSKYRIVVLGNLNTHFWSKSNCFTPVMSQLDFKLMLDISCHLQIPPKQRDFVQAFYQSSLPSHEKYICKPLFGCKLTPPPRTCLHFMDLNVRHDTGMRL